MGKDVSNLIRSLEQRLVDMVCHVGVDINLCLNFNHYAGMLGFIGGLGIRKADALLLNIRSMKSIGGVVDSRKLLLERKVMGACVYINAAGFIRISRETALTDFAIDPLDNTRIHPECYITFDFATKICADALEVEARRDDYFDVVRKLMTSLHLTLEDLLTVPGDQEKEKRKNEWLMLWAAGGRPADLWSVGNNNVDSKITKENAENFYVELRDAVFDLVIDTYADSVFNSGQGKRLEQFNDIKEELRYPWLDVLRLTTPLAPPSADMLFTLLTGGEKFENLYVGMKVSCKVTQVLQSKALLLVDDGLKGFVHISQVSDKKINDINEVLAVGTINAGVIIRINKEKASVEVAMKNSLLEHGEDFWMQNRNSNEYMSTWLTANPKLSVGKYDPYFNEDLALKLYADYEKKRLKSIAANSKNEDINQSKSESGGGMVHKQKHITRLVYHPLFQNCNYIEAQEKLKGRGAGAVIIRPSSKGPNALSITWAFQEGLFAHIEVEERGKKAGEIGLGKELYIRGMDEPFSDLDEIYSRYIIPMNELVNSMVANE